MSTASPSFLQRLFGRTDPKDGLLPLYNVIVAQGRQPHWYIDGAVPDTLDGRFDMIVAVLAQVLMRLEQQGATQESVWLTELFVDDMDGQLRQEGIGDVVVGKHIGRMVSALGGREFSRPVRLDQIGHISGSTSIVADAAEREALMRRFGLLALDALEADYRISEENGSIFARGRVRASLAQACVATGQPVAETIDTDFLLRFVPDDEDVVEGAEMELDAEDCDTIGYSGNSIDMGEAVAETVALAMAPYPRASDADAILREAGVLQEDQAGPFAALLALKGKE